MQKLFTFIKNKLKKSQNFDIKIQKGVVCPQSCQLIRNFGNYLKQILHGLKSCGKT
jgi:hypothetical protein